MGQIRRGPALPGPQRRNVEAHLPDKHHGELRRQLNLAYHQTDHRQAVKALSRLYWLRRSNPDAAASLQEGLEETLTVVRLGVPELLRKTLSTTNPIESAFSVAESSHTPRKSWRDGDMRHGGAWRACWMRTTLQPRERPQDLPQFLDAWSDSLRRTTLDAKRKQA